MVEEWLRSNDIRKELETDEFVVMPNHIHGIVFIQQTAPIVGATGGSPGVGTETAPVRATGPAKRSLGSFVGGFKASVSTRINAIRATPGHAVWQRNFYERIVRDEDELNRIRQYVIDNPAAWPDDKHNPAVIARSAPRATSRSPLQR